MKNIFIQVGYKILHYLYINRTTFYSLYKKMKADPNIKFDWKTDFNELRAYFNAIGGLIVSQEDIQAPTAEEYIEVGESIEQNTHKTKVEYEQSKNSCAIYGQVGAFVYNSWVVLSTEEIEQISEYCIEKGYRKRGQGMEFVKAGKGIQEWLQINKGIEIEVERVPYNGARYKLLKEAGYACALWGYITKEKLLDAMDDGVINNKYSWKEKKYGGHCWREHEHSIFVDNYKSRKVNGWINEMFEDFIQNGYHFLWCYFPIVKSIPERSDYEKFLERFNIIEHPQPDRIMNEMLFCTLMWRFYNHEIKK